MTSTSVNSDANDQHLNCLNTLYCWFERALQEASTCTNAKVRDKMLSAATRMSDTMAKSTKPAKSFVDAPQTSLQSGMQGIPGSDSLQRSLQRKDWFGASSCTAAAGARLGIAKLSVLAHSGLGLAPKKGQGIKGWQAVRPQTPSRISMALPHTGYADWMH